MHSRSLSGAAGVLLVLLCLRFWATLAPTSWLWGLDALADLPVILRWAGLALFAACLVPRVGTLVMGGIALVFRHRRAAVIAAVLGFGAVLALLPTRHALHGDAQVLLSTIEKGLHAAGAAHREPLAQWIVTHTHRFLVAPLGGDPSLAFRLVGLFCGVAYLALALAIAARLADSVRGRTVVAASVVATGVWPLFSGHAELYGVALVPLLLFALTGLRWIDGRGGLIEVGVAFALAGLCHAQIAFAAPALLLLAGTHWKRGGKVRALAALGVVPILVLIGLLLMDYPFRDLGREVGRTGVFLPPLSKPDGRTAYSIYSWVHAVDFVNVSLLLAPLLWILLPASLTHRRGGGNPSLKTRFLAAMAIGPLLFAFAAGPALGMVRDWDLYSIAFVAASLWVAARAVRVFELPGELGRDSSARGLQRGHLFTARDGHSADAMVGALSLFALCHAFAWLVANHDVTAAENRLERVVQNEALFGPKSRSEIWRYLASSHVRAGRGSEAAHAYLEAIQADPKETIPYRQLASLVIQGAEARGRPAAEGLAAYHDAVRQGVHGEGEAHLGGLLAAVQAGDEGLAVQEGRALLAIEPNSAEYRAIWADLARRAGETAEAEAWYRRALEVDAQNIRAMLGLACLAGMRGDRAEVILLSEQAREASPWNMFVQQFQGLMDDPAGISPERCRALLFFR